MHVNFVHAFGVHAGIGTCPTRRPDDILRLEYQLYALLRADRVVAVVGAGHLPGMREVWQSEIDIESLVRMPVIRQGPPWGRLVLITSLAGVTASAVWFLRARRR